MGTFGSARVLGVRRRHAPRCLQKKYALGASSDFIAVYENNLLMLAAAAAPVFTVMPALVLFFALAAMPRFASLRRLPGVPKDATDEGREGSTRLSELYQKWKTKFVFSMLTWVTFATLILTARSVPRLYLGIADGMFSARVWACRYSK